MFSFDAQVRVPFTKIDTFDDAATVVGKQHTLGPDRVRFALLFILDGDFDFVIDDSRVRTGAKGDLDRDVATGGRCAGGEGHKKQLDSLHGYRINNKRKWNKII